MKQTTTRTRTRTVSVHYAHILDYVARTPWAILPAKMTQILSVLALRAAGQTFSAEEIRAQIGEVDPPKPSSRGTVAIVPLRGIIAHRMNTMEESSGGMSAERFAVTIRRLAADASISAILIDSDSPGGTISGVLEAAQAVYEARAQKRIVAIANATMASAAYWIASQAHEIVAIPSVFEGRIGSIGVYTVHEDLSGALERAGVKITLISAGKRKVDGNPFVPLSDEQKAEIQANVDAAYERFVKDVARGRSVTPAAVRNGFGEGAGLSAVAAKAAGVIDRIATFEDTLARLVGRHGAAGATGTVRAASGGAAMAAASVTTAQPVTQIEPDEDGNCPEDYEMGEDGLCHMMEAKAQAQPPSATEPVAAADTPGAAMEASETPPSGEDRTVADEHEAIAAALAE